MRPRFARALAAGALGVGCALVPATPAVASADVAVVLSAAPVSETESEPARAPAGRDLGRLGMITLGGGLVIGIAAFILSRRPDGED